MDEPAHGEVIGSFRNAWRQRDVTIYTHPSDATLVVTCGKPFDQAADPIWTIEPREQYARFIGKFRGALFE